MPEFFIKNAIGRRISIPILEVMASQHRVDLTIEEQGAYIYLIWIARRSEEKGSAIEVMKIICEYADQNHKIIRLEALSGKSKLINYYKQFGFSINSSDMKKVLNGYWENEDSESGPIMQRNLRTKLI